MTKSLKIANVARRFTFDEWGGTETVVWNTAEELIGLGYETKIFCTAALSKPGVEHADGIDIERFPYFYARLGLSPENAARLDKKGGNPFSPSLGHALRLYKPDLIHCHTMGRLGGLCRRMARRMNIPYVVSLHGGHFEVPQEEIDEMVRPMRGSFNIGKFFDITVDRPDFLEEADGIICVGYNEYMAAAEKYPGKHIEYLPNGVDTKRFSEKVDFNFREKHGIKPDAEMLLCVSRIDYQKNQMLLLDLAAKMKAEEKKFHLVLIGPVTADCYFERMKKKIEKENLHKRVTIIPGLPFESEELTAAYQTADVFILPSLHEPFGIVALEAWSAGIPLLAANIGGLARLVKDGETAMVFDPGSLESLCDAKARLQQSLEVTERLVFNAARVVEDQYSWRMITQKLEAFYKRVLKPKIY